MVDIYELYKKVLDLCYEKQSAHVGSNLSVVPILYDIYKNFTEDDVVIVSKGHAAVALYSVLLLKNIVTKEEIDAKYCGHVTTSIPGVYFSTGSLGHGLSIAIGCAIAQPNKKIHVILSDGELDEGSTMEAIKYIDEHKYINNLKIYVDANGFSATKKTMPVFFKNWERFKVYKSQKGRKFLPTSFVGLVSHYKKLDENSYTFAIKKLELTKEFEEGKLNEEDIS